MPSAIYKDAAGKRLPSVTTILGMLNKPALVGWAARVAAEATAAALRDGATSPDAIAAGIAAPEQRRDSAADAGTLAHDMICAGLRARGSAEPVPYEIAADVPRDVAERATAAYERFEREIMPHIGTVHASEWSAVLERDVANSYVCPAYGGTLDHVAVLDGVTTLVDVKTSRGVYPETLLQLAGYERLWLADEATCEIDQWAILHVTPEAARVILPTDEQMDAAREMWPVLVNAYHLMRGIKLPKEPKE